MLKITTTNTGLYLHVHIHHAVLLGTVENHGKNSKKTRHTFVKIAKITAVYIAANLLKTLGKIHTMLMSRSHIPPVSNKAHRLW